MDPITTTSPWTFASELVDGQVIIDPRDGVTRTVTESAARPVDRILITFRDGGAELDVCRHTQLDLVDIDQLHSEALEIHDFRTTILTKGTPALLGGLVQAGFSKPELSRQSMLHELHARALAEPCDCYVCVQRRLSRTLPATTVGCSGKFVWSGEICQWVALTDLV